MNELKILLAENRTQFKPAETLTGVAGWRLSTAPQSAELRLFWHTRGKGTEDVAVSPTGEKIVLHPHARSR
jgi:hypothetical protein